MQDRSQGSIFFSSPQQKLTKISQISMLRQSIRISLPVFWTRASSLLRRVNMRTITYVDHIIGRTEPEILMVRDINFSIKTFGFCDKPQKISPLPCETTRVSGHSNKYRENYFSFFWEKILACVSTMSGAFYTTKTSVLNLTKLIGLLPSNVQAILPAWIQFWYLQRKQILALQKKGSYSGHATLENGKRETL